MKVQLIDHLIDKLINQIKYNGKDFFLVIVFFYFVSMMIVMGNGASFLGRYLSDLYTPIANTIGLNTTWNFFSPDPAHNMYIQVAYYDASDANNGKESETVTYPEKNSNGEYDYSISKRRISYLVRFLILDPPRIESNLAPWLCAKRKHSGQIYIETILERIPPLEKVVTLKSTPLIGMILREKMFSLNFDCGSVKSNE